MCDRYALSEPPPSCSLERTRAPDTLLCMVARAGGSINRVIASSTSSCTAQHLSHFAHHATTKSTRPFSLDKPNRIPPRCSLRCAVGHRVCIIHIHIHHHAQVCQSLIPALPTHQHTHETRGLIRRQAKQTSLAALRCGVRHALRHWFPGHPRVHHVHLHMHHRTCIMLAITVTQTTLPTTQRLQGPLD